MHDIKRLKISKLSHNNDGTTTLIFDLDSEFVEWFKKKEGLKRFSHKRFQEFISNSIKNFSKAPDEADGYIGKIVSEDK